MPFNFRKTIRIMPGVNVNLSKTGVSLSVGPRGAKVTLGRRGIRTTASLPGTGVSWSKLFRRR